MTHISHISTVEIRAFLTTGFGCGAYVGLTAWIGKKKILPPQLSRKLMHIGTFSDLGVRAPPLACLLLLLTLSLTHTHTTTQDVAPYSPCVGPSTLPPLRYHPPLSLPPPFLFLLPSSLHWWAVTLPLIF